MIYDRELKENLIQRGVDSKIIDMPAVGERLKRVSISPDSIVVNSDGTFNFGKYILEKKKDENGERLAIIEYSEVDRHVRYFSDGPVSDDDSSYKEMIAKLTYVNSEGIEVESQEINNSIYIYKLLERGTLTASSFEGRADLVGEKFVRDKGLIIETDKFGRTYEFYDHGNWDLDNQGFRNRYDRYVGGMASFGTIEGDKPSLAVSNYDINTRKLVDKYPALQGYAEKGKSELMHRIDERTANIISENYTLKGNNERLQKMLSKTLSFIQEIRDKRIINILLGRKAEEFLKKDAKQIDDGR